MSITTEEIRSLNVSLLQKHFELENMYQDAVRSVGSEDDDEIDEIFKEYDNELIRYFKYLNKVEKDVVVNIIDKNTSLPTDIAKLIAGYTQSQKCCDNNNCTKFVDYYFNIGVNGSFSPRGALSVKHDSPK
jgi:hypothetical protein